MNMWVKCLTSGVLILIIFELKINNWKAQKNNKIILFEKTFLDGKKSANWSYQMKQQFILEQNCLIEMMGDGGNAKLICSGPGRSRG